MVGRPAWAAILRALREAAGVTQEGWASQLGLGRTTVQRWERGDLTPDAEAEAALLALCREKGLFRRYDAGPLAGASVTADWLAALLAAARLGRMSSPVPSPTVAGRLIVRSGGRSGAVHVLGTVVTRIGRAADNDICVECDGVSRRHAEVRREGQRYVLADLGSKNGTFRNGRRLASPEPLDAGDLITLPCRPPLVLAFQVDSDTATVRADSLITPDRASIDSPADARDDPTPSGPHAGRASPERAEYDRPGLRIVLFTDVEGSTQITERLGDAAARSLLRAHERLTRDALQRHGGVEVKTLGDGFLAWFRSAADALACAVDLQRAVAEHNEGAPMPVRVRVGLNAGEPVAEGGDLFGTTVNLAARIATAAAGGEILVADVVRQLAAGKGFRFADRGEQLLRGYDDPTRLFALTW
jgi:class 3 adenylate cyclase/DNA-binding XRE family transcriptional regulator